MNTIRHAVSGPRTGPALLLLHAMGANRHMWDECAAYWSRQFTVIACDLRGAGESPPADRPWTPDDHVADVEAVRATLGIDRVIPIGCAIGAVVAAWYAHRHPMQSSALVLSEPTLGIGESARSIIEARAAAVRQQGMKALVPAAIDAAFHGLPADERYAHYTSMFLQHDPVGYANIALGMAGVDLREALRALRLPTLVIVGKNDLIFTPEMAREVHGMLQQSGPGDFHELEHAAHFPPFQSPAAFSELVTDFLKRRAGDMVR